ncbi:hypothetical protein Pelo_18510 [Pelomyxa schiedti]|nr:hypothetical protein Pelo_18510 [Pelomyxa schiedti]
MAKQLVDSGGDGDDGPWSGCRLLTWPKDDPTLIDDIREMPVKTKEIPHSLLYLACKGGNLDVVKWVMSKFHGVGTEPWELLMAFHAAVRWGHLNVVKWLASTTGVIAACTKKVADWLESTFHVMDQVNATPSVTEQVFKKICNSVINISVNAVIQAFWDTLRMGKTNTTLLLWNTFNVYKTVSGSAVIEGIVEHCALSAAKKFMPGQFSLSDIVHGLSHSWSVQSGKVVKWLIEDYHLQEELPLKATSHLLLGALISSNKTGCAEWFITTFQVTLNEVVAMKQQYLLVPKWDTWRMLLCVFPEITGPFAMQHFLDCMRATPLHEKVSSKVLGLRFNTPATQGKKE